MVQWYSTVERMTGLGAYVQYDEGTMEGEYDTHSMVQWYSTVQQMTGLGAYVQYDEGRMEGVYER